MSAARALIVVAAFAFSCVALVAGVGSQLPPLPAVATPTLFAMQQCSGSGDPSPGCPHDPAPWVCTLEGKGGAHTCSCKMTCNTDEDGNVTAGETFGCSRFCARDKCFCHIEEECPNGSGTR